MDLVKPQHLVSSDLAFKVALLHCDGHVVNKPNPRNIFELFLHACLHYLNARDAPHAPTSPARYSNSTRTLCTFTQSPGDTCTLFTVALCCARTCVSIFMASKTT